MRTTKRIAIICIVILPLGIFAYKSLPYILQTFHPTVDDARECEFVLEKLLEVYEYKVQSTSSPGRPAAFIAPMSRQNCIILYGIIDIGEQDKIVTILKQIREEHRTKKIQVRFYEAENWKSWENQDTKPGEPSGGGSRGEEKLIRKITI